MSVIQLLEETPKPKKSDFILTENYHIRLREGIAKRLIDKIRFNFNLKAPYRAKNFINQNILYDNIQQLAHFVSEEKAFRRYKTKSYVRLAHATIPKQLKAALHYVVF